MSLYHQTVIMTDLIVKEMLFMPGETRVLLVDISVQIGNNIISGFLLLKTKDFEVFLE